MGRLIFTRVEIDRIRSLLYDLRRADADEQKKIRGKLRRMDFDIHDFTDGAEGFTRSDLDELITRGTVRVED